MKPLDTLSARAHIQRMSIALLPRDAMRQAVLSVRERLNAQGAGDSLAAKIRMSSATRSKAVVFNGWHAASDNVTEGGANAAWGCSATRLCD